MEKVNIMKDFDFKLKKFKDDGLQLINESINDWTIDKENNSYNEKIIEVLSILMKCAITKSTKLADEDCNPYSMTKDMIENINDSAGHILNGAMTLMYIGKYLSQYNFNIVTLIDVLSRDLELRDEDKKKSKRKKPDKTKWTIDDYDRNRDILTEEELRSLTEVKTLINEEDEYDEFFI